MTGKLLYCRMGCWFWLDIENMIEKKWSWTRKTFGFLLQIIYRSPLDADDGDAEGGFLVGLKLFD